MTRWTALLMGWVWLGAQGQRLGWSVASGLVPVALWWALRITFAHGVRNAHTRSGPLVGTRWLGGLTALGVLLVGQLPQTSLGHGALLLLAVVWAAWLVQLEQAGAHGHCRPRWRGAAPLAAGLLTALCTTDLLPASASPWVSTLVLLAVAAVKVRPRSSHASPGAPLSLWSARPTGSAVSSLPATAMGLMMGSLWLNNVWCNAAGWSSTEVVLMHLGLMGAMPTLAALVRPQGRRLWLTDAGAARLPLVLLVCGTTLLLGAANLVLGLAGMGLLAAAWSLNPPGGTHRPWPALAGPVLLLAVGWHSPTAGPLAQQWAYGAVGAAALTLLMFSWLRQPAPQLLLTQRSPPA
jgi:hypothetical protein